MDEYNAGYGDITERLHEFAMEQQTQERINQQIKTQVQFWGTKMANDQAKTSQKAERFQIGSQFERRARIRHLAESEIYTEEGKKFNPEDSEPNAPPKFALSKTQRIIDVSDGISYCDQEIFTPNALMLKAINKKYGQ